VNPAIGVFSDASVLLAAAGSPTGGSSAALDTIARDARYEALASPEVLLEARRNVAAKFPAEASARLAALLPRLRPRVVQVSETADPQDLPASLAEKDRHVVYACLAGGAVICLTLDRKHLLTDELRAWGMRRRLYFIRPAEFLAWHRLRDVGV
jgi:predicted nucleic acid-binding protein